MDVVGLGAGTGQNLSTNVFLWIGGGSIRCSLLG